MVNCLKNDIEDTINAVKTAVTEMPYLVLLAASIIVSVIDIMFRRVRNGGDAID